MKNGRRKVALATVCCFVLGGLSVFGGCKDKVPAGEVSVYMPDGAPALALAELMAKDTDEDGVTYRVVAANAIDLAVTGNDSAENADFCILPLNSASLHVHAGAEYQMLGTVTHGNMYLISKSAAKVDELSDLVGETVGVMQLANVPGLTFKAALNKQSVAWQEVKGEVLPSESVVNLQAVTGVDGSFAYYLAPEPLVSKKLANTAAGFQIVGDLQTLYGGQSGETGYPQAVLVGKKSFLKDNAAWTKSFLEKVDAAGEWLQQASEEKVFAAVTSHFEDKDMAPAFTVGTLGKETISRCGIDFVYTKDCRGQVGAFLAELVAVDNKKAALVAEEFYYVG